jgi:hypothetical protein
MTEINDGTGVHASGMPSVSASLEAFHAMAIKVQLHACTSISMPERDVCILCTLHWRLPRFASVSSCNGQCGQNSSTNTHRLVGYSLRIKEHTKASPAITVDKNCQHGDGYSTLHSKSDACL